MKAGRLLAALAALLLFTACDDSALPPGATYSSVSGVVVDSATNQPVSGATVTVDTVLTATTGADGKFTFARVPAGDFDYSVQAQGYKQLVNQPSHVDAGKSATLTIPLDH